MTYPLVDLSVAESLYRGNRPFRVRLVYTGHDENRKWIEEWLLMLYDGTPDGDIQIRTGRLGHPGYDVMARDTFEVGKHICKQKMDRGWSYEPGTGHFIPPAKRAGKLKGPFAQIRELVRAGPDQVEARDENGKYLLTLTESGAEAVLERDPFRVSVRDG